MNRKWTTYSLYRLILILILLINAVASSSEETQNHSVKLVQRLPEELQWKADPTVHGLQTATLLGSQTVAEPYVRRTRMPAHFKTMPHSHPNLFRMVTVLSGTIYFAFGDKFDESKLKAFSAGSFFTEPENMPHYSITKEEAVVLQLNAIGPASTDYVNE